MLRNEKENINAAVKNRISMAEWLNEAENKELSLYFQVEDPEIRLNKSDESALTKTKVSKGEMETSNDESIRFKETVISNESLNDVFEFSNGEGSLTESDEENSVKYTSNVININMYWLTYLYRFHC